MGSRSSTTVHFGFSGDRHFTFLHRLHGGVSGHFAMPYTDGKQGFLGTRGSTRTDPTGKHIERGFMERGERTEFTQPSVHSLASYLSNPSRSRPQKQSGRVLLCVQHP
jgi:hypothetical protein